MTSSLRRVAPDCSPSESDAAPVAMDDAPKRTASESWRGRPQRRAGRRQQGRRVGGQTRAGHRGRHIVHPCRTAHPSQPRYTVRQELCGGAQAREAAEAHQYPGPDRHRRGALGDPQHVVESLGRVQVVDQQRCTQRAQQRQITPAAYCSCGLRRTVEACDRGDQRRCPRQSSAEDIAADHPVAERCRLELRAAVIGRSLPGTVGHRVVGDDRRRRLVVRVVQGNLVRHRGGSFLLREQTDCHQCHAGNGGESGQQARHDAG